MVSSGSYAAKGFRCFPLMYYIFLSQGKHFFLFSQQAKLFTTQSSLWNLVV